MSIAVVYYSSSGKTRLVAAELAARLDARLCDVRCAAYDGGFGGWLRVFDILVRRRPSIEIDPLPEDVDLIVFGTPVWDGRAAPPILSAINQLLGRARRFALFVTCDGRDPTSPPEPALADMSRGHGMPLDSAIFRRDDLKPVFKQSRVQSFATALEFRLAAPAPPARTHPTSDVAPTPVA